MKIKNDQRGIAHVAMVLLVVVVIGVVGFAGWRVLSNMTQQKQSTPNTQTNNSNTPAENLINETSLTYKNKNNSISVSIVKPEGWSAFQEKRMGEAPYNLMTIKSPEGSYLHISDRTGFGGGCQDDSNKYILTKKIPTSTENVFFTEYSDSKNSPISNFGIEDLTDANPAHKVLKIGEGNTGICQNIAGYSSVSSKSGDTVMVIVSTAEYEKNIYANYIDISNDTEFINMLKTLKIQK